MDWFSWLAKTGLDRAVIYEYGLLFTRNELEEEDVKSFNHEFLQSMGIAVAKHRLEILKLARKEVAESPPHRISRLFLAVNKAKRCFAKGIGKWVFPKESAQAAVPEWSPFRAHWTGALRKHNSSKEFRNEKELRTMRSGPLDRRLQERFMVPNRSLSVSGPLDGMQESMVMMSINRSPMIMQDRFLVSNRSPDRSGPLDGRDSSPTICSHHGKEKMVGGNGVQPLWSLMFQDMKPT